jgi:hypothetical protein
VKTLSKIKQAIWESLLANPDADITELRANLKIAISEATESSSLRKCSKCGEILPQESFYHWKDARRKIGLRSPSACRQCIQGEISHSPSTNVSVDKAEILKRKAAVRFARYKSEHEDELREKSRRYYYEHRENILASARRYRKKLMSTKAGRAKIAAAAHARQVNLTDTTVCRNMGIKTRDAPKELIEAKREQILLGRVVKLIRKETFHGSKAKNTRRP